MKHGEQQQESRTTAVRRITFWGLAGNGVLFTIKLCIGLFAGSQVLIADAVHSLSDAFTDIAVIIGAGLWDRPPDACHPYGHRRIETVVTIVVGAVLAAAGIGIAAEGLNTLRAPVPTPPRLIALPTACLSIIMKEWLFRWTLSEGIRLKSSALKANAWHHRSDAFSSIPALIAIAVAYFIPGWALADKVGAVVVAAFILQAAFKIGWPAMRELIDAGAPVDVCRKLYAITERVEGVKTAHALRTRYVGSRLLVDLHVLVDGNISVYRGHAIAEEVTHRLKAEGPDIADVIVHVEPNDAAERQANHEPSS